VREPPRASTTERGYDGWWKRYSERYRREHPYCVACLAQGIYSPACLVDHIVPFHQSDGSIDEHLRRDPANHQSLCDRRHRDCHGKLKKPIEEKLRGNPEGLKAGWERLLSSLHCS
jgi:5-methylcytosine-specific restriction endonuclease McrA